jgi:hypothetical protein
MPASQDPLIIDQRATATATTPRQANSHAVERRDLRRGMGLIQC